MKPQERVDTIRKSRLEPSMKLLLVMVSSYMSDDRETVWCSEESLSNDTGLADSTVRALLKEAEGAGLIRRWWGDHRAKDMAINWSAVTAYTGKVTTKGGPRGPKRPPTIGGEAPTTGGESTADYRHPDRRPSADGPPTIGELTADDRHRTDHEPTMNRPGTDQTPLPPAAETRPAPQGVSQPTPGDSTTTATAGHPQPVAIEKPATNAGSRDYDVPERSSPSPSKVQVEPTRTATTAMAQPPRPPEPPRETTPPEIHHAGRVIPGDLVALFAEFPPSRYHGPTAVINAFLGIGIETTAGVMTCSVSGLRKTSGFGGRESRIPDNIAAFLVKRWGIALPNAPPPDGKARGPEWMARATAVEAAAPGTLESVGLPPSAWDTPAPTPRRNVLEHP